jgi:hypothetical protein
MSSPTSPDVVAEAFTDLAKQAGVDNPLRYTAVGKRISKGRTNDIASSPEGLGPLLRLDPIIVLIELRLVTCVGVVDAIIRRCLGTRPSSGYVVLSVFVELLPTTFCVHHFE